MTPHDEMRRGEEAARLLQNPLFAEAWQHYDATLLALLADHNTAPDKAAEVRGWLIAARKARSHLERIVADGKVAADRIRHEEARRSMLQNVRAKFR